MLKHIDEVLEVAHQCQDEARRAQAKLVEASRPLVAAVIALSDKHYSLFEPLFARAETLGLYSWGDYDSAFGDGHKERMYDLTWATDGSFITVSGEWSSRGGHEYASVRLPLQYLKENGESLMVSDSERMTAILDSLEGRRERRAAAVQIQAERELLAALKLKFEGK